MTQAKAQLSNIPLLVTNKNTKYYWQKEYDNHFLIVVSNFSFEMVSFFGYSQQKRAYKLVMLNIEQGNGFNFPDWVRYLPWRNYVSLVKTLDINFKNLRET